MCFGESPLFTDRLRSNNPPGQGNSRLGLGALCPSVSGAKWVGTTVESANQLDRTVKCKQAAVAMIANVHHATTAGTITVGNVQFPEREVRICGPTMCH